MRRINKQSKPAESLANYLSSVEIANNEKKRSRLNFEHKLGYNIKTDSKSHYAYVRSKSRSKDSMVSHRGHNCISSALTILDSALTS